MGDVTGPKGREPDRDLTECDLVCASEILEGLVLATTGPRFITTRAIAEKIAGAVLDHAEMRRGLVKSVLVDEITMILDANR